MPEGDHVSVHAVDAQALFLDQVKCPEEVCQSGISGVALGKDVACVHPANEAARAHDLYG